MQNLNAGLAAREAHAMLAQRGIQADPQVWQEVDGLLKANPQNYAQLRQSPEALATAYQVVAANRMNQPGFAQPVAYQQAPPPAAYGQGQGQSQRQFAKPAHMQHLERMLKVNFTPEEIEASARRAGGVN
jgi:hypothetical protein